MASGTVVFGLVMVGVVSVVALVAGLVEGWAAFKGGRLAGSELFLDYERDGGLPPPRPASGKVIGRRV